MGKDIKTTLNNDIKFNEYLIEDANIQMEKTLHKLIEDINNPKINVSFRNIHNLMLNYENKYKYYIDTINQANLIIKQCKKYLRDINA